jgi:cephalosporin hydroxylase
VIAVETTRINVDRVRGGVETTQRLNASLLDQFHRLSYHGYTWSMSTWLGVPVLKHPCDLFSLQELLAGIRPALIIETGTAHGGSALFLATICGLLQHGHVLSIDLEPAPELPQHPRITYRRGSSTDPEIVAYAQDRAARCGGPVLVLLDSDHHAAHVRAELVVYAPLVTVGSYLVVEDTNINGRPVLPDFGPGPAEAVAEWLRSPTSGPVFEPDLLPERFLITMHPGGWLRRVA